MNVVQVPARWVLGFYLLIDNLLPFLFSGSRAGGGVAYGAHLGGFAAGWVLAWYLDRRELQARPAEYKSPVPPILPTADPAQLIQEAIRAGAFEEAGRAYFGLDSAATHRLLQPEESLALADWLAKNDRPRAALTVYRRHLRDYPAGPGVAAAHLGAGRAQLEGLQQAAPAYQHFLDALSSDPSPEEEAAARAGLEAIARLQKYTIHVRRNA
jgi:hypothetical protein